MKQLVVVVALAGCFSSHSKKMRYAADSAVVAAGAAVLADSLLKTCEPTPDFGKAIGCGLDKETGPYFGGLAILIGAVLLLNTYEYDPDAPEALPAAPPPPRVVPDAEHIPVPTTANPELRQLTMQASVAARVGQCFAVKTIARRVASIDGEFRAHGFASDAAIAGCLD